MGIIMPKKKTVEKKAEKSVTKKESQGATDFSLFCLRGHDAVHAALTSHKDDNITTVEHFVKKALQEHFKTSKWTT